MSRTVRARRVVARRAPGRRSTSRPRTALQQHVDFFDTNGDGRITLGDTYRGLRRLGYGPVLSAAFAAVINAALGTSTSGAPSLTVNAERIHAGKHRSDSGVYDKKGRFSKLRFGRLFARYDVDGDGALDGKELNRLFAARRTDLIGHIGSRAEFGLLLDLAGQIRNGRKVLTRQRLERFYDGTLFYDLARARSRRSRSRSTGTKLALPTGERRKRGAQGDR